jgi:hypothetical protein
MNQNTTEITNNYYIDAESLINLVVSQEQARLIGVLKSVGAIVEKEDGLYAVAYTNYADVNNEGHSPEIAFVKVGDAPSEQA